MPGTHAAIPLMFRGTEGSMCGALLPTGQVVDLIDGLACTLIDNGMPCVVIRAADLGLTGRETPEALEADAPLRARVEAVRLQAGRLMGLGAVAEKSVPKVVLVSPPVAGGAIHTRCFIPHRVHAGIGVFAAVTVATACLLQGSTAWEMAARPPDGRFLVEHPTGSAETYLETGPDGTVTGAGTIRTARKLFDGLVFA